MSKKILVCGPPFSGKTTSLSKLSTPFFNADKHVEFLYRENKSLISEISKLDKAITISGIVNKAELKKWILNNSIDKINKIVWPFIVEKIKKSNLLIYEALPVNTSLYSKIYFLKTNFFIRLTRALRNKETIRNFFFLNNLYKNSFIEFIKGKNYIKVKKITKDLF